LENVNKLFEMQFVRTIRRRDETWL